MRLVLGLLLVILQAPTAAQPPSLASIAGAVKRSDTVEPAVGVRVTLTQPLQSAPLEYNEQTPPPVDPSTTTDDRGAFRLFYVTPGRYYVVAGAPHGVDSFAREINGVQERYPFIYYPGVADINQATAVEIRSGTETNVELVLARQPGYRVRGRVVDARTGEPPSSVRIALTTRSAGGSSSYQVSDESMTFNPGTGAFELRGVMPGSYLVTVTWGYSILMPAIFMSAAPAGHGARDGAPDNDEDSSQQTENELAVIDAGVAYAALTVAAEDVDDLVLTIAAGGSISGRLRIDGSATLPGLEHVKAQLTPALDGAPAAISNVYLQQVSINADGTFRFDNLKTGEYRVTVDGLESGFYVKTAQHGANDALNRSFHLTPSESITLEVMIGWGAPQITGTVTSDRLEPMPDAQVVLVPDRYRDRVDLFRAVVTGPDGRFTIANAAPGDYKLFAWEAIESYAYFDPVLRQQDEARAQPIHIGESANQNVQLRVIPAATP